MQGLLLLPHSGDGKKLYHVVTDIQKEGYDMGTNIRNSVSESNPYYIPKHEYLATKHFALQYNEWRKSKKDIESRIAYGFNPDHIQGGVSSPVEKTQEDAEKYSFRMSLVERAAKIAGEDIWEIVLIGVTTECNYEYLKLVKGIPCCKDVYYKMYRKFFWALSKEISFIFATYLMDTKQGGIDYGRKRNDHDRNVGRTDQEDTGGT